METISARFYGLLWTYYAFGGILGLDKTQLNIVLQIKIFKRQNTSFFRNGLKQTSWIEICCLLSDGNQLSEAFHMLVQLQNTLAQ